MNEAETRAYYDIPENAAAMCDMLMGAHPGWLVRRIPTARSFQSAPIWVARRVEWTANQSSLFNENAGVINLAMYQVDAGAVV
ncbi:hypothetical protein AB0I81_23065 [Nonomuraea sp. NPDC050404]|uniref:hypothetical protein n=1 Tax=Nonomuraea sp. NPDC050404 TaxID=3155783 RepID=UPI0033C4A5AC